MARYELDEDQCEAIYRALTGDANRSTLQKTKKLLELQGLHHGVAEVNEQLRVFEGTGESNPGLLRMFNPQHDLLAGEGTGTKPKPKDDTRDMFADASSATDSATRAAERSVGGVDDTPRNVTESLPMEWADNVPSPRPSKGALIVWPSGQTASVVDVLGWDAEREGFRIVDTGGWDGHIVSYGLRDAVQWRLLAQLLDYPDASDYDAQPQGSVDAIAEDLRTMAADLLAGPELLDDPADYAKHADRILPLLPLINSAVNPEYLQEYVTGELAEADDNAHALARLLIQHADAVLASGTDLDAELQAARESLDTSALADEDDDDEAEAFPTTEADEDDAHTEQALAEGSYEPPAEDMSSDGMQAAELESDQRENAAALTEHEDALPPARPGVGSAQRERNVRAAGGRKAVPTPKAKKAPAKGKPAGKPAGKKGKR